MDGFLCDIQFFKTPWNCSSFFSTHPHDSRSKSWERSHVTWCLDGQTDRQTQLRPGRTVARRKRGDTMKCYGMTALSRQPADTALSRYNFPTGCQHQHQTPSLHEISKQASCIFGFRVFSWSSVCLRLMCCWKWLQDNVTVNVQHSQVLKPLSG